MGVRVVLVVWCVCVVSVAPAGAILNSGGGGGGGGAASSGGGGGGGPIRAGGAPGTLCEADFCECPLTAWGNVTCRCPSGPAQGEVHLRAEGELRLPEHTTALRVEGCARVEVHERAVHALRHLRSVELRGAQEVVLHPYAFSRPGGPEGAEAGSSESGGGGGGAASRGGGGHPDVASAPYGSAHGHALPPSPGLLEAEAGPSVVVEGARLPGGVPSYAFRGRLARVALRRCAIQGSVAAFAFASLAATHLLEMADCTIAAVEGQAFKRFAVERLVLSGLALETPLPSRALADVRVRGELVVERVSAPRVRAAALSARGPRRVAVRACRWGHVEGEALRVAARGPIVVRDNAFGALDAGAFVGLGAEERTAAGEEPLRLHFANNSVGAFAAGALAFNASAVRAHVSDLRVARPCDCAAADNWRADLGVPAEELRCQAQDASGRVREGEWRSLAEAGCLAAQRSASLALMLAAVGAGVAALVLGACAAWAWSRWRRRRRRRQERGPARRWAPPKEGAGVGVGVATPEHKAQAVALVLPARTYRETELHVELERAEPLDK
ncbi:hypothetical protein R5R35_013990 [Gryllus longicercus]|uniref:Uncharacterized protein n=1 Tax=Gryllus longicercus TaxID=2509291 RepID=A0AAN9VXD4_9ORTH